MKNLVIYVHGKGGNAEEAKHYANIFKDSDVIGFDYKSEFPWDAKEEFSSFYDFQCKGYDSVTLIANSIGAYLSMNSLAEKNITRAMFISPIVNMEKLIEDMMTWANITEEKLQTEKEIVTEFGETLSWEYFCYAKNTPIKWEIPTFILYGDKDNLTSKKTITEFATQFGATLTIMNGGEHWFHTEEQMNFLDRWIEQSI